jgi:hypothetical protein
VNVLIAPIGDPKGPNFEKIGEAVLSFANKKAVRLISKWGREMTSDWDGPPTFETESRIEGGNIVISCKPVGPNAQKWIWVSFGTGTHGAGHGAYDIYPTGHPASPRYNPSGPKALAVAPYAPHTSGEGVTVRGGAFGGGPGKRGAVTPRQHVVHPGIKPRHFEKGWRVWANFWWPPGVRNAIAEATREINRG